MKEELLHCVYVCQCPVFFFEMDIDYSVYVVEDEDPFRLIQ